MSKCEPKTLISGCGALLLLLAPFVLAAADDLASIIKLSGIPGPYSFERFCKLPTGDLWQVGGNGEVQYLSSTGVTKKIRIPKVDLNGVFFATADRGWVVGERGSILHTENGGNDWKAQRSGVTDSLQAITCTDESHCWAVGEKGTILNTSNRGTHWTTTKLDLTARLFAVNFVNHQLGWAVGENGVVIHTSDGGATWKKQRAIITLFPDGPFATPTNLLAVQFVNENQGWVAGAGGIARTVNGGETWETTEIENHAFIGLVSNDGNTVWAVSREGSNYVTRNAGVTWGPVNSDSEKVSTRRK